LQQAEVELRACFIARSEVIQMQNTFDEQSKQHSHIVVDLQEQLRDRDNRIHLLEERLEEQAQHLHTNQMKANEVWVKDGLLREQSNEIAALRQEHENAVAEHKAAEARLDAEREDLLAQLEHLKGQVHEKERQVQEADEQVEKPDLFPLFGNISV
jgi:chromosome segregation ATPase